MNKRYYINVKQVMDSYLPRPRKKHKITIIANNDEWLPIIDADTGVCFK